MQLVDKKPEFEDRVTRRCFDREGKLFCVKPWDHPGDEHCSAETEFTSTGKIVRWYVWKR